MTIYRREEPFGSYVRTHSCHLFSVFASARRHSNASISHMSEREQTKKKNVSRTYYFIERSITFRGDSRDAAVLHVRYIFIIVIVLFRA